MRHYELCVIVHPDQSEQVPAMIERYKNLVLEQGGQVHRVEDWGRRQLAYPIQKKTTGFYFLIEFTGEGSIVNTLETQYRRDERIIRFLTFKQDKFAVEYSEKRRAKLSNKSEE